MMRKCEDRYAVRVWPIDDGEREVLDYYTRNSSRAGSRKRARFTELCVLIHFFSMFHIGGTEGTVITPESRSERYATGFRHCAKLT